VVWGWGLGVGVQGSDALVRGSGFGLISVSGVGLRVQGAACRVFVGGAHIISLLDLSLP